MDTGEDKDAERLPEVPELPEKEMLAGEKETLGFYVTGHPLNAYLDKIADLATADSSNVGEMSSNADIAMCGILTGIQRKSNREGRPWAAAVLEDLKGSLELLVFANQYADLATLLVPDLPVLIRGSVRLDESAPAKVSVNEIVALDNTRLSLPAQISITVRLENGSNGQSDLAERLQQLFSDKPGDTDVRLRLLRRKDFLVSYDLAERVRADREFRNAAEKICGTGAIEVIASG